MEKIIEKWSSEIATVTIGATKEYGGTREKVIKVGGEKALPMLSFEGKTLNKPVVFAEVMDFLAEDLWPLFYTQYKDFVSNIFDWIKEIENFDPDGFCIRLTSCHPDTKNNSIDYIKNIVPQILKTTKKPLIFLGCDNIDRDTEILPVVCEICRGEKILVGMVVKENYKTISLSALTNGHSVIAQTPIDINLAKQLNILINDIGMPLEKIVMHHTTGGLGYGFEYCYSIMERSRISGLQGDKIMATPIINLVGEESWKIKEAKVTLDEEPFWGEPLSRTINWEITTSLGYLQAGADILVLAHPESIKKVKEIVQRNFI
jgi:acetyl-CoA decarbonylase/synthase complex subunit delta